MHRQKKTYGGHGVKPVISIFGECGKLRREEKDGGQKKIVFSHLADALMKLTAIFRVQKKTNKYRIIIKQKLSANEVIKSRVRNKQDEPVDESEIAPKTPPSYFNPKLKDLPAKEGLLQQVQSGERGSLFDMSDYINLSPERELSLMQLEGPRQDENS
ncbi:hypothetical protein BC829DRAFT_414267 [Chytridium lagenaria]|nr:hypothetical protein BC829DRAFT_414267 [Chytridium lagenaria]